MNSPAEIASAASFAALLDKLDYLPPDEVTQVRNAYKFADQAHLGVTRKSGEPYITHPIAVAALCAEWQLDANTLMAAVGIHAAVVLLTDRLTRSDLVRAMVLGKKRVPANIKVEDPRA